MLDYAKIAIFAGISNHDRVKRIYIYLTFIILLCLCGRMSAKAQVAYRSDMDTDLSAFFRSSTPGFSSPLDDYTQYTPAAVMVGLKAFGYEGRSSWGRMIVSDAFSFGGMFVAVKGLKYIVGRERPDGSDFHSFPSGHSAVAFMSATMLHKEYGWRSPWFSIGGYSVAALTGVSRLAKNEHWMSDVVTGAALGIGSVHLGYFLTDLIFKDKGLYDGYVKPEFAYDGSRKHYVAELLFGRRFVFGDTVKGSLIGLSADIPVVAGAGVTARATGGSLTRSYEDTDEIYTFMAGGYWNLPFAKILEFQAKAMAGGAVLPEGTGFGCSAGLGLSLIVDNNFKIKAFADYETAGRKSAPWLNSVIIGYSASWFW